MKQLVRKGLKEVIVDEVPDPMSIAHNGVRIANISLGEKVAVIGLGLVGQLIAQLVRLQGGIVIATDLKSDRVDLARRLGAAVALPGGEEFQDQISTVTDGQGVDCVIIAAAAKSAVPCQLAVQICRDRGRIVDVGAVDLSFPWYEMYRKEIKLLMARAYGPGSYDPLYEQQGQDYPLPYVRWTENRNMQEFLRRVSEGGVQIQPLVTHQFLLDDASRAYQAILDPAASSLAVLLRDPAASSADPVSSFHPQSTIDGARGDRSDSRLGVALVGAANLAKWAHLPNLQKISFAYLRSIHSSNGPRGKR